MTQALHTPGPWVATPKSGRVAVEAENGCLIAEVTFGWAGEDEDAAHMDAYLIAAAPSMKDDLIEAERMFRWYGDLHAAKPDPEKAARNYEMADRLAATIARAEGRA